MNQKCVLSVPGLYSYKDSVEMGLSRKSLSHRGGVQGADDDSLVDKLLTHGCSNKSVIKRKSECLGQGK